MKRGSKEAPFFFPDSFFFFFFFLLLFFSHPPLFLVGSRSLGSSSKMSLSKPSQRKEMEKEAIEKAWDMFSLSMRGKGGSKSHHVYFKEIRNGSRPIFQLDTWRKKTQEFYKRWEAEKSSPMSGNFDLLLRLSEHSIRLFL